MTRFVAALLLAGVAAVAAGCSSGASDSFAESTGPPAVCESADALQASMADLRDVQVVQDGTAALEAAVASVQSDLREVADDASAQYSDRVDGLQSTFTSLQTAVGEALDAPSQETLRAVTTSVSALADDVTSFLEELGTTC